MKKLLLNILIIASVSVYGQQERKYVRQGNKYFKEDKQEKAEIAYRKAIDKEPNSLEAQYNLAGSLYKQKKFEDAVSTYSTLTGTAKSKEEIAKIYHNIGNAHLQSGKLQESIEAYKNALRNNPGDDETRYNLAFAMSQLQKQKNNPNPNEIEPSEYAKKLKKQAEYLVSQRKYKEAYELMKNGEQKDQTVLIFKSFTERINDIIKISE